MTEPNIIKKIQSFVDNRKDYRFESPSGINPSVIIFGENHGDAPEIKELKDLIKELGLANYVLLAEHKLYFENNWKGKYGCSEVVCCDLKKEDKDKKQRELLRKHIPTQELEKLRRICAGLSDEEHHIFDCCIEEYPYIMKLFYDAREKEMGEIIRSNHPREPSESIVVIIGHYHAREDSEVHKILEKEEIDHTCIWNEKAVEEVKKKYQYFRRNSAQDSDMRL